MNPQDFPGQPAGPAARPAQPAAAATSDTGKGKKKGKKKGNDVQTRRTSKVWAAFALVGLLVTVAILLVPPADDGDEDQTFVTVATRSIPALAQVKADWFEARQVPEEVIADGALTGATAEEALAELNLDDDAQVYARYPIASGSQVHLSSLSYEAQLPAGSNELAPDERLVSVSANVASSVAGVLRVGDRVDVVATGQWRLSDYDPTLSSVTGAAGVVEDVEIVAITIDESLYSDIASSIVEQQQTGADDVDEPKSPEDLLPGDPVPGIYTLKVHRDLVNRLTAANAHLDLALVYRGQDAQAGEFSPATVLDVLCLPPRGLQPGEQLPELCERVRLPEQPYTEGSVQQPAPQPESEPESEAPSDEGTEQPEG